MKDVRIIIKRVAQFWQKLTFFLPLFLIPLLNAAESESQLVNNTSKSDIPTLGSSLVTMFIALLVVIAIIAVCAWILKRIGGAGIMQDKHIQVLANRMIGPKEKLTVVKVANNVLLLGVTQQSINLLQQLPDDYAIESATDRPSLQQSFATQLAKVIGQQKNG